MELANKPVTDEKIKLPSWIFNYINSDHHLNIDVRLCAKCIGSLKQQLQEGTIINVKLVLALPASYVTDLLEGKARLFFGYCACQDQHYVSKMIFKSFKGKIDPIHTYSDKSKCNTTFHITNIERRKLSLYKADYHPRMSINNI